VEEGKRKWKEENLEEKEKRLEKEKKETSKRKELRGTTKKREDKGNIFFSLSFLEVSLSEGSRTPPLDPGYRYVYKVISLPLSP
jgi:hypothetical protein